MTTILINEKTDIGRNIVEMLKAIARMENEDSIKFLDETEFLLSSEKNRKVLLAAAKQIKEGKKGKTVKTSDLWK